MGRKNKFSSFLETEQEGLTMRGGADWEFSQDKHLNTQAHTGDISSWVPDHHSKMNTAISESNEFFGFPAYKS